MAHRRPYGQLRRGQELVPGAGRQDGPFQLHRRRRHRPGGERRRGTSSPATTTAVRKHHTTIGDHAFIGSDTMLVAPVTIGAGARTGAGSVVTHDVPPGELACGCAGPPATAQRARVNSLFYRRSPADCGTPSGWIVLRHRRGDCSTVL
ncbi:MAG: DapH/DapD/GlmU-related protein [Anaerolineae bacterium]